MEPRAGAAHTLFTTIAAHAGNYCRSPEEMKIIHEEGSPMGPLLRAVNAVADAIAEDFPRVAVDTLAYQYTRPDLSGPRFQTSLAWGATACAARTLLNTTCKVNPGVRATPSRR